MLVFLSNGLGILRAQNTNLNELVAANLNEMAALLEQQGADSFHIAAYKKAAQSVDNLKVSVAELFVHKGLSGLDSIPGIGRSIAAAIAELVSTGHWAQLERLRGSLAPEQLFRTIPGIGPELARKIFSELHVETLEALEVAAHDGRLEGLKGVGRRRVEMLKASLAERLGRRRIARQKLTVTPSVEIILDVDQEYREKAAAGSLRKIAPKRFNPSGEAWLPILHTRRQDWMMTALYSNTQRAHELHKTMDWVVIYFQTDNLPEDQCTVVTESGGTLKGRRVIRGREAECAAFHSNARQV